MKKTLMIMVRILIVGSFSMIMGFGVFWHYMTAYQVFSAMASIKVGMFTAGIIGYLFGLMEWFFSNLTEKRKSVDFAQHQDKDSRINKSKDGAK